jgi:hypothetical protein
MDLEPGQIYFDLGGIPFARVDEFGVDWAIDKDGFDGWGATASTLRVVQKPRASGGWGGAAYASPRSIAMSGRFYAPTPSAARAALDRLNSAVSLDASLLTVYEDGSPRWMMVRRTDRVLHKWITPTSAEWSIQVVAEDHRKFGTPLTGTTLLPVTSGGFTVPFTGPFAINSTVVSGQISLTNPGNEVGPVVLRIDGPVAGPQITHSGTGKPLVFASSLVLAAGEWLTVDMDKRTAMANDQASRNGYITTRGWSGFDPGVNVWGFTATGYNAASRLTVTATPASE